MAQDDSRLGGSLLCWRYACARPDVADLGYGFRLPPGDLQPRLLLPLQLRLEALALQHATEVPYKEGQVMQATTAKDFSP
jgi:hypothetical protein